MMRLFLQQCGGCDLIQAAYAWPVAEGADLQHCPMCQSDESAFEVVAPVHMRGLALSLLLDSNNWTYAEVEALRDKANAGMGALTVKDVMRMRYL